MQCLRPHSPRRIAFTLAEVLITLGIIGVVAALTLPTLIANYQKKETISKIQKVYTVLNQAFKLSEVDNGEFEYWDVDYSDPDTYFEKYWKPYLKINKICKTYKECLYPSNSPWYYLDGSPFTMSVIALGYRVSFYTSDGTYMAISLVNGGGTDEDGNEVPIVYSQSIYVDINGAQRPNQLGKDLFMFLITKKGVMPLCYDYSRDEINEDCSKNGSGRSCLAKIISEGWQIGADYPWK